MATRFHFKFSGTTVTIASGASLPLDISPVINQIVTEAISGDRQIAELGDTRDRLSLVFPMVTKTEYDLLVSFFETTVQYKLTPFEFKDFGGATETWTVWLDSLGYRRKRGNFFEITVVMTEQVT